MIKILVKRKANIIDRLEIIGHANYDLAGKDIVCAAVSASVLTTVNGLLSVNENCINHKQDVDKLTIIVLKSDVIVEKLLNNMLSMLTELKDDYSKHIEIIEEV